MDPRQKELQSFFEELTVFRSTNAGNIVKVNMHPEAEKLFLTVDDLVELGEKNNIYKDYYVTVPHFVKNLCEGNYSIGSGVSKRLKELHDKVDKMDVELEEIFAVEEMMIEEDMDSLKNGILQKLELYFEELQSSLKQKFRDRNAHIKTSLVQANQILKEQLLERLESGEFFDLNKFYVEFQERKGKPLELEKFITSYVKNQSTIEISKEAMKNLEKFQFLFDSDFKIENLVSNYVLNIEKLKEHQAGQENDYTMVISNFINEIEDFFNSVFEKVDHFTEGSPFDINSSNEDNLDESFVKMSPAKLRSADDELSSKFSPKQSVENSKRSKPSREIKTISFKKCEDLSYEHRKFVGSYVGLSNFELHGTNVNNTSTTHIGYFLRSLGGLNRLNLDLSVSALTQDIIEPLSEGLSRTKELKHLQIDLSRCKMETEAFQILSDAISVHSLSKLVFRAESMKISPPNVGNLGNVLYSQNNLNYLCLNLNFNELDFDDLRILCDSIKSKVFNTLILCFKGCGLPKDAFKQLCDCLKSGISVEKKLILDFTM